MVLLQNINMQLQGGTMQGPPVCVSIKYNEIEPEKW